MTKKNFLRHNAIAVAASLAFGAAPAIAFDSATWNWEANVSEQVVRDARSSLNALPSGQASLDALQMMVGDSVSNASADTQTAPPDVTAPSDAMIDLATVTASANAYGNVRDIESEVALSSRVGQYHFGGFDPSQAAATTVDATLDPALESAADAQSGTHDMMLDELRDQAATGLLLPHQTSATADTTGLRNIITEVEARAISNTATLDLVATAAAPLAGDQSVTVDPLTGEMIHPIATDAIVTADTVQFSYGEVSALGQSSQTFDGMTNLGGLESPVNQVRTTAIGNLDTARIGFQDAVSP